MTTYQPTPTTTPRRRDAGAGWRTFAGIVIAIVGIFNFIDGLVAVANPHYYVIQPAGYGSDHLVFGTLNSWGWTIMILGIIQFLVGLAVLAHQRWAAMVGIVIAGLNAIGQLLWLGVNPWWSLIAIGLDVLVIYGLAVHGLDERRYDEYAMEGGGGYQAGGTHQARDTTDTGYQTADRGYQGQPGTQYQQADRGYEGQQYPQGGGPGYQQQPGTDYPQGSGPGYQQQPGTDYPQSGDKGGEQKP